MLLALIDSLYSLLVLARVLRVLKEALEVLLLR